MPAKMEMAYYEHMPLTHLRQLIEEIKAYKATVSSPIARKWCDDFIDMLVPLERKRSKSK